jgi:hypothetical protein
LEQRRAILTRILDNLGRQNALEAWVTDSPLVAVTFDGDCPNKPDGVQRDLPARASTIASATRR